MGFLHSQPAYGVFLSMLIADDINEAAVNVWMLT